MKIQVNCPTCHKIAETTGEMKFGTMTMRTYKCGHSQVFNGVVVDEDSLNITSLDGKNPFPYQLDGARFAERANLRCLIADEMALGKTIQAIMLLVAHPEMRPFVVFCKSGLRVQFNKELVRWGDLMTQIIDGKNDTFLKGMDGFIISLDTAWRIPDLKEKFKKLGINSVIIDECQLIKNDEAKRTRAIQDVCREQERIIALSGTPIKNNAGEYYPILNILRPDKFPSKSNFVYGWCDSYFNGYGTKTGGLKNPQKFKEFTKDFIIRRERADVLPDLPKIFRSFQFHELGEMVEAEYVKTLHEFQDFYTTASGSFEDQSNILAYLAKMRHLAGLAKIDPICEYVEEFITTTDRKLAIFVHHKDVGITLRMKLENMGREWPAEWGKEILQLTSEMDAYEREEVINKWRGPDYRVCILSTLASGEGLNLQFCSDCILAERQWNPANEEQAESRFPRPGSLADKINSIYFIAVGTVDEFFSELVEQKREICSKTMSGEAVSWSESGLVKELAQILAEKGGRKWGF